MAEFNDITPTTIGNDAAVTASPSRTSDATLTSLLLTGSLDATFNSVTVLDYNDSASIAQVTNDRFQDFITKTPTYYIKVEHDINQHCFFRPGTGGGNDELDDSRTDDDAWRLASFQVNDQTDGIENENNLAATRFLPYGGTTIDAGVFTATDGIGQSKEWTIKLAIDLQCDGAISANATLDGDTRFWGFVNDDFQLAQHAYWNTTGAVAPSVPNQGEGDILAAQLTKSTVENLMANNMALAENDVNDVGNVVDTWKISFDAVPFDSLSNLSQYGQSNNVNPSGIAPGDYVNDLFAQGDRIVASQPKLYPVTISTAQNGEVVLVNDYVYGIVQQS